jgi:hypothetical protein
VLLISNDIELLREPLKLVRFFLFKGLVLSLGLFILLERVSKEQITMEGLVVSLFNLHVDGLVQKYFHLFLEESVNFSLELFLLLLCWKSLMIDLLVVLFNRKSEDGFFEGLPQFRVSL